MKCPYCGAEVAETRCEYCDSDLSFYINQQLNQQQNEPRQNVYVDNRTYNNYYSSDENLSDKKKSVALKLCILSLFIPGLHRIYTGYTTSGIILLVLGFVFFMRFIPVIFTIIDLVTILSGNFKDKNGRLLS